MFEFLVNPTYYPWILQGLLLTVEITLVWGLLRANSGDAASNW